MYWESLIAVAVVVVASVVVNLKAKKQAAARTKAEILEIIDALTNIHPEVRDYVKKVKKRIEDA